MIIHKNFTYTHTAKTLLFLAFAISFLLSASGVSATESHSHHKKDDSATQQIQFNNGELWHTDKPLRAGMVAIREIISTNHDAIIDGSLKPENLVQINNQINEQITSIVSNCKLPPAADENLHLVLADIIEGGNAIAGKSASLDAVEGMAKITHALSVYATHFDHPDWNKE